MPDNSVTEVAYRRPPVVEVVLGVQFERLPRAKNGHWGAFWSSLNLAEWPQVEDAPPIESQLETFDLSGNWSRAMQIQMLPHIGSRLQLRHRDGDRMIQVQNGRLHFNWLGNGSAGQYPRYEKVREGFLSALDSFLVFVRTHDLGDFLPNQWEVTYVNRIPRGTVWNTPAEWDFFRLLSGIPSRPQLIDGESFGGQWHFVIPPKKGRLHIEWRHGRQGGAVDGSEHVRLTFTARGPTAVSSADITDSIASGLDIGHSTVVHSFRELMSDRANRFWEESRA